jgi:uncharacterized membrane protein
MSDVPPPPSEPPPPGGESPGGPTPAGDGSATSTGLDANISGLLTYLVGFITGLVFYLIEKKHVEVRFHAAQSILISIVAIVINVVFTILIMIPGIGILFGLLNILVGIGFFVLWIILLIKGYNLEHFKLPIIGDMAEEWASKGLEAG